MPSRYASSRGAVLTAAAKRASSSSPSSFQGGDRSSGLAASGESDPALASAFRGLDDKLAAALAAGHIALIDAKRLRDGGGLAALARRQDLPPSAFLEGVAISHALRPSGRQTWAKDANVAACWNDPKQTTGIGTS